METTVTVYVPLDEMEEFELILNKHESEVNIYGQKMHRPICYTVNIPLSKFNRIKHLIKN